MLLGLIPAVQASVVWSADFEEPTYYATYSLTGQGDWSNPSGWTCGMIVSKDDSQQARVGGDNGYSQLVCSPAFSTAFEAGQELNVSFSYYSESGVTSNYVMLYANNGPPLVWINFDSTTKHLLVNGTQTFDTNFTFTADTYYNIKITIYSSGFDVAVNGTIVADNQPYATSSVTTSGVIKWLGGGNGGTSAVYSYMDNLVVSVDSEPVTQAPVFSPAGPKVNEGTAVQISSVTTNAKIYYTTDGSEPTSSGTPYSNPTSVSVLDGMTLKAIAVANDSSRVTSQRYEFVPEGNVVWSADFEEPTYYATYPLTGQGDWSNPSGWTCGMIVSKDGSQQARMGGDNGYSQLVCSPSFSTEFETGKELSIAFTYYIESGVTSNYVMLYANGGPVLVSLNFDATTGHILVSGTKTVDTGVSFPTNTYFNIKIKIYACGFDVAFNGAVIAADQTYDTSSYTTLGVIKWLGGGNGGVSAAYSYMDDLVVSVVSGPETQAPVFSPAGPEINGFVPVTISSATSNAVIYYTTDGSEPTTNSSRYSEPTNVMVSPGTKLKAMAVANGHSRVTSQTYKFSSQADVVWSADFEEPTYYATYPLTGQGDWSNPSGWTCGMIVSKDGSQQARMGGDNGYAQLVSSPAFSTTIETGKELSISFSYYIENGVTSNYVMLYANNGPVLVSLNFDSATGHILVSGTQTFDTEVSFPTDAYFNVNVMIYAGGFDVAVNGTIVADNQPYDSSSFTSSGVIRWLAGGNGGTSAVYSYMDNLMVCHVPSPTTQAPVFSPTGPKITGNTDVTISSATSNARIYYTTDGSTPTISGSSYSNSATVTVTDGMTLKALAVAGDISMITKQTYKVPTIPIMAYYGIPETYSTLTQFQLLKEAGFTHQFQRYNTVASAQTALDLAEKTGIKLIPMFLDLGEYPNLDLSSAGYEFVYAIKNHPALEAYFIKDEPNASEFSGLATRVRLMQNLDPNHWCYINLSTPTDKSFYESFLDTVPVKVLSVDGYPITTSGINSDYFQIREMVSSVARTKGVPFWAFALSTAHSDYPIPTLAHLRFQVYTNLAYGAQGIEYFTYWQPVNYDSYVFHDAPVDLNGNKTPVWNVVKQMNTEIKGLSPVFLGAIVKSVGHTGSLPTGTTAYADSAPITSLTTSGSDGAVVSRLVNGHTWYLAVVNRDINNTMALNVTVDASRGISTVSKTGIVTPISGSTFTTTVDKADIVVFKWAAIPGDANLDGEVSVSDLSVLAAYYNTASGATWAMGDFDGDKDVDVADLSMLAANYNYGSASTVSWAEAYAQAFGTTNDADETTDASADDSEDTTSSVCSSLGLSLIAGLALMGLMIVKLDE
jgi:hypothetical protein